jgi:polysaccharide export outer membrane protein
MRTLTPLLLAALLLACKGPKALTPHSATPEEAVPEEALGSSRTNGANTLGPSDLVEVRVFQEADLSGAYRVSPEGLLDFPLCGPVSVKGIGAQVSEAAASDGADP